LPHSLGHRDNDAQSGAAALERPGSFPADFAVALARAVLAGSVGWRRLAGHDQRAQVPARRVQARL